LIPSLRHADFIAVAEMPSFIAASYKGRANSLDNVASLRTTGFELTRACCPALRRGKIVFTDVGDAGHEGEEESDEVSSEAPLPPFGDWVRDESETASVEWPDIVLELDAT